MSIASSIAYIVAALGVGYAIGTRVTRKEYEPLVDRLLTVAEILTAERKERKTDD